MKGFWCVAAIGAVAIGLVSAPVSAQSAATSACPAGLPGSPAQVTQDACQQAVDLFTYMAPQLGAAIAGGNATLGQGGTLGGLGHFSLGLRANVVQGSLPQVDQFQQSVTGAQRSTLPTKDNQPLPMPVADAAFGIFRGFPAGVTNVLGVDLLVNVAYIPEVNQNNLSVKTPNGSLKFGYGARLGIVQESVVMPGVSVSYLKRDLPTVTLDGATNNADLSVRNLNVGTSAYRLVASKHFIVFGLAAGVGRDTYDESALVQGTVQSQSSQQVSLSQSLTRTNIFADLSMNLPIVKLIVEVGQVSGGNVQTYNSFAGKDANASRLYGSAGLRFAW